MNSITPNMYMTNTEARQTADRLMARGGLDKNRVMYLERIGGAGDAWRAKVMRHNALGKGFLERGEIAVDWVEVSDG